MTCPRCHSPLRERQVLNPVSRVDNTTYICNDCGNEEALFNYYWPDKELPPVDERILHPVSGQGLR